MNTSNFTLNYGLTGRIELGINEPIAEEFTDGLNMHELLVIDRDEVSDVREMSDLEFEEYITRLRRLKGLHVGL